MPAILQTIFAFLVAIFTSGSSYQGTFGKQWFLQSQGGGAVGYSLSKGWDLNAVDEYIDVDYDASLNITDNYSFEAVINCTAADTGANHFIVSRRITGGVVYQAYIRNTTGYYTVYVHDGTNDRQLTYQTDLTGAPHQVGFTVGSNSLKLYVDGVDVTASSNVDDSSSITGLKSNTIDEVTIGATEDGGTAFFKGKIGRASIWDTAVLTEAEYAALYDSGNYTVDPTSNSGDYTSSGDLVMALLMETGDTAGTDTVLDGSGNNNHGTTHNLANGDLVDW